MLSKQRVKTSEHNKMTYFKVTDPSVHKEEDNLEHRQTESYVLHKHENNKQNNEPRIFISWSIVSGKEKFSFSYVCIRNLAVVFSDGSKKSNKIGKGSHSDHSSQTYCDEKKYKRVLNSQTSYAVRAKAYARLDHGWPSQRHTSGTDPSMKVCL